MFKRLIILLALLVFFTTTIPASANATLIVNNNTNATIRIRVSPVHKGEIRDFLIPPLTRKSIYNAVPMGNSAIYFIPEHLRGIPTLEQRVWVSGERRGFEYDLFAASFGQYAMFDPAQGVRGASIVGEWQRSDGHRVYFASHNHNSVTGKITWLTSYLSDLGFRTGETTFWLERTAPGRYEGSILYKYSYRTPTREKITLLVDGDSMTGGGSRWVRVQ